MAPSVVHMKNETRLGRCSPRTVARIMGMGNVTLHKAPIHTITTPRGMSAIMTNSRCEAVSGGPDCRDACGTGTGVFAKYALQNLGQRRQRG